MPDALSLAQTNSEIRTIVVWRSLEEDGNFNLSVGRESEIFLDYRLAVREIWTF